MKEVDSEKAVAALTALVDELYESAGVAKECVSRGDYGGAAVALDDTEGTAAHARGHAQDLAPEEYWSRAGRFA